jgi:hypothetical protein
VQWARLSPPARSASIGLPIVITGLVAAIDVRAGVTIGVLLLGMAAATAVYAKNRTDRHNAAVDAGEIAVVPDPHFRVADPDDVPADLLDRADDIGRDRSQIGRVLRFDQGWIVGRRNPKDVAVVIGDDGGWARFDPRTTTDLWAVGEYGAGRGRDG